MPELNAREVFILFCISPATARYHSHRRPPGTTDCKSERYHSLRMLSPREFVSEPYYTCTCNFGRRKGEIIQAALAEADISF